MGVAYIVNPTRVVTISNPRKKGAKQMKRKRSKKIKTNRGGENRMKRRHHRRKKTVVTNRRRHRVHHNAHHRVHHRVHHRAKAVAVNRRHHRHHHRRHTMESLVANPRRHHSRHHRRTYKRNPIAGMSYGKFIADIAVTGVGFVGAALIPQYILPMIKVSNTGAVKYVSEIVSGGVLGFAAKLLKQDLEAPIWVGTGVLVLVQLAADLLNMTNTFNVRGYGYLPPANGLPPVSGNNYGTLPGAMYPEAAGQLVASGAYA